MARAKNFTETRNISAKYKNKATGGEKSIGIFDTCGGFFIKQQRDGIFSFFLSFNTRPRARAHALITFLFSYRFIVHPTVITC